MWDRVAALENIV